MDHTLIESTNENEIGVNTIFSIFSSSPSPPLSLQQCARGVDVCVHRRWMCVDVDDGVGKGREKAGKKIHSL
jgi:hypothetical protein